LLNLKGRKRGEEKGGGVLRQSIGPQKDLLLDTAKGAWGQPID